ncbi:hypothetical protein AWM70_12260 [Paenibacillus yonginensis]|uniref:Uncharacterized protein n=1 Tax=Paenibacillus yonginensis TaxID=1462996 RepID=A0A1B1N1G8_9BACL|nr:hypothetical protein [Paenibacillus yonginensis]ANS75282.1 hypothetical protein AWM70_12260 [Paenibacillus yonginensis]
MKQSILNEVIEFYTKSSDFNGIPYWNLAEKYSQDMLVDILMELIEEKKVSANFTLNPHIKQFEDFPLDKQINAIKNKTSNVCLYPTESVLLETLPESHVDKPFTRMLYFGKPQLEPLFFEISVLEQYFSDPRYNIHSSDYSGSIHYSSENELRESDQILLDTFGIGYDTNNDRVVAVYLRYLNDLTPEHQQRWKTYLITDGNCRIAYEYYQNTIAGEWADNASIYDAFVEEIYHINKMSLLMFEDKLFRNDFKENRPSEFRTIFLPTKENFNSFILTLDKMMSENINKDFFKGKVDLEVETEREDGKILINQKGTVQLLDEWLRKSIKLKDERDYGLVIKPFKKIRKLRQKPAHAININNYDRSIFKEQNNIIHECYVAVRMIRLLFANHPAVRDYKLPEWLYNGNIKIF